MHNVELDGDITAGSVRLRPVETPEEMPEGEVPSATGWASFRHTADAIVDLGEREVTPTNAGKDAYELGKDAWAKFRPVHDALRFLEQHDFAVSRCTLHNTPECDDQPRAEEGLPLIWTVPTGSRIRLALAERQEDVLEAAAEKWADDEIAETTRFEYAVNWQFASMSRWEPAEAQYIKQWIAFEILYNRWCDEAPDAPKDTEIKPERVRNCVRKAVQEGLQDLVANGTISKKQAKAVKGAVHSVTRIEAHRKAKAFLTHYGVRDVGNEWLRECISLRNDLMHGRTLTEAYGKLKAQPSRSQDVHSRILRLRELVNRYVMSLIGYEPNSWDFAALSVGRYVKKGSAQ